MSTITETAIARLLADVDVAIARKQYENAKTKLDCLRSEYFCHLNDLQRARVTELVYQLQQTGTVMQQEPAPSRTLLPNRERHRQALIDNLSSSQVSDRDLSGARSLLLAVGQNARGLLREQRKTTRVATKFGFAAIAIGIALGSSMGAVNPELASYGAERLVAMNVQAP